MKIKFWGTRGSIPTTYSGTTKYGGNTPCISIEDEKTLIIIDAGSGIRSLSQSMDLSKYKIIHILLTHYHMDHIQGFGFFSPLFDPNSQFHIWGPGTQIHSVKSILTRYLSPPLFPVRLRDLPSKIEYHNITKRRFSIDNFRVFADYICHPGATLGYRISSKGKNVTFLPDHEPRLGSPNFPNELDWISGFDLAYKTDLLIHDGQFTEEEYQQRIGWGHSSIQDAVLFSEIADVKSLSIFHHDPSRGDDELDAFIEQFDMNKYKFNINFSKELSTIEI